MLARPHSKQKSMQFWAKPRLIAGIDEAGRGSFAGPLVAAAVILKPKQKLKGLDDSKKLTSKEREKLFKKITKNCVSFGTGEVSSKFIDENGLTKAVHTAYALAIEALDPQPDFLLIDGIEKPRLNIPYETIIRGDGLIKEIMAASVVAKVTRDKIMIDLAKKYPKYGFEKHKGYGTRLHKKLLALHKPCQVHRMSYTPVCNEISNSGKLRSS